jgi:hypothetical protein
LRQRRRRGMETILNEVVVLLLLLPVSRQDLCGYKKIFILLKGLPSFSLYLRENQFDPYEIKNKIP